MPHTWEVLTANPCPSPSLLIVTVYPVVSTRMQSHSHKANANSAVPIKSTFPPRLSYSILSLHHHLFYLTSQDHLPFHFEKSIDQNSPKTYTTKSPTYKSSPCAVNISPASTATKSPGSLWCHLPSPPANTTS